MQSWGDALKPVEQVLTSSLGSPVSVASAVFSFPEIFLLDEESRQAASILHSLWVFFPTLHLQLFPTRQEDH